MLDIDEHSITLLSILETSPKQPPNPHFHALTSPAVFAPTSQGVRFAPRDVLATEAKPEHQESML